MKKLFSLVLIALMLLVSVNTAATEVSQVDIMTNGDFEAVSSGWDCGSRPFELSRDYSKSPNYSYKMIFDPGVLKPHEVLAVRYFDAIPGATYTFSAFAYIDAALPEGSVPGFTLACYDESNQSVGQGKTYKYDNIVAKEWCEGSASIDTLEGTTKLKVTLYLYNATDATESAVCYFDDASLIVSGSGDAVTSHIQALEYQKHLAEESQASYDAQLAKINATEFADGAENLISNPGFEYEDPTTDFKPTNWGKSNIVWGESATIESGKANSGTYSLKIKSSAAYGRNQGVAQTIYDGFEPGRKYLFQAKVKVKSYTRGYGASLKVLPFASAGGGLSNYLNGVNSDYFTWEDEDPNGENWHDLKCVIDLPEETQALTVYLLARGDCEIYFDDVKFALAKDENRFKFFPERTFFYLDNESGSVFADFNSAFEIADGSTVEFTLSDGETVLDSASIPATEITEWQFNLNKMPEMLTKYTVKATYKDPSGNQIGETLCENVYKTTRPYCLDKDGNYIDENGEYFYPLIGYGGSSFSDAEYAQRAADAIAELKENHKTNGINVYAKPVQADVWAQGNDYAIAKIKEFLDEAQAKGYKYFYTLGSDVPSGYPNGTSERTELILKNFANHPAIFAWSVIDEASLKVKSDGTFKTYDFLKEWLEKSYIQIRKYDQSKPIYILDTGNQEYMEKTSRISDIFANDPYPGTRADTVMQTYKKTKWSTGGTNGTTPVAIIAQMTPHSGENSWRPTITEVRHQFYQAFWGGAKMVGFFSITGASDMTEELFTDPEGREEYWMSFAQNEKDLIYEHFTTDKTLLIKNNQEGDVWYRMWRASDNNIYLTLMNMNNTAESVTANINLVSDNVKLSIDGYTAELINGDEVTLHTSNSNNNVFGATLPLTTVAFYKITPKTELDFSVIDENASAVPEEITLDIKLDGESIESKSVTYGDDSFTLTAATNGSENPLWSVESGDCVSVNYYSGEVTIKKGGTAVIKAAVSSAYDTIEITVNKKEITAVALASKGFAEREYNGSKSVDTWTTPPTYTLTGAIDGDDVTLGGKYEFNSSDEGTNKPISLSDIVLTGTNAEGYVLAGSVPLYMNNVGTGTITKDYQGNDPAIPVIVSSEKTDTKYSFSLYTDSDLNYESIVYIAYYDDNDNFLGIKSTNLRLLSKGSVTLDIEHNSLPSNAKKIKLFVWSYTMKPLSEVNIK